MAGSSEGSKEPEEEETARPGFQVSGTCAVLPADNTLHFVSQQLTADPAGDTFLDCGGERWGDRPARTQGTALCFSFVIGKVALTPSS